MTIEIKAYALTPTSRRPSACGRFFQFKVDLITAGVINSSGNYSTNLKGL
jgi:hypothetical protein